MSISRTECRAIYLLRCHGRIAVHALKHGLRWLPIGICWIRWYLGCVHSLLSPEFLLLCHLTIVEGGNIMVTHVLWLLLLWMARRWLLLDVVLRGDDLAT